MSPRSLVTLATMRVMDQFNEAVTFAQSHRFRGRAIRQLTLRIGASTWFMFGAGGHMVWIDPDNEAVVVARWLDGAHSAGFVRHVAQALGS